MDDKDFRKTIVGMDIRSTSPVDIRMKSRLMKARDFRK